MKKILSIIALLLVYTIPGFAEDTWTVAGSSTDVLGTAWAPANTENDMTLTDGVYILAKTVTLTSETTLEYKVVKNHSWGEEYPSTNASITIPAGTCDVVFRYNPEGNEVKAITFSSVKLKGEWDNWGDGLTLSRGNDTKAVWTGELDLSSIRTNQQFKQLVDADNWLGTNQLTLIDEGNLVNKGNNDSDNFTLKNAYCGYKKYNVTASWNDGWTLKIEGTEARPLPGDVLWTSDALVEASWTGGSIIISDENVAGLKVGDVLHVGVEGVTPSTNSWSAQVFIRDHNNTQLESEFWVGNGGYYDVPFNITGDILGLIKTNGLQINGSNFSTKKVTVERGVYTGSENTIWFGNATLTWSQVSVNKCHFINTNVEEGCTLKLIYEATGTPDIQIRCDWDGVLGDPTYDDGYATLELTEANATAIKEKGLFINANGICLKQIELLPKPTTPPTEIVLWSSATSIDVNWGWNISVDASKMSDVAVGDLIRVHVDEIKGTDNQWATQITLRDINRNIISETYNIGEMTAPVTIDIPVTGDIYSIIKDAGFTLGNANYTTKKVELIKDVYSASEYSVWVGDQELDWTQVQVQPIHFNNLGVEAGKVLRLRYDGVEGKYPNVQLIHDWHPGEQYGTPIYVDGAAMLVITEDMVEKLSTGALTINASGIRLKQIELVPFKYYTVLSDNSWTTSTEMTENAGVFTAELGNVAGKHFALFPITALNADANKISDWNKAIRPTVISGNFDVNYFINYQSTTTTGSDAVWYVATNNTAKLALTYTPSLETNNYTITTDATEKVIISDAGWATYSNDQAFSVTGAEAYITKDISKSVKLEKIANPVFAGGKGKGKGILLKGSSGEATEVTIAPAEVGAEFADLTDNYLAGSGNDTYGITGDFGGTDGTYASAYILKKLDDVVGFYKLASFENDNVIDANKAFLAVPDGVSVDSRIFLGFDDGETTSIDVRSKMEDVRGEVYNLNGQRVAQPMKGLYIVNGKKVVVK